MSLHPKVKLAQLRAIGWRLWDPIGLLRADGAVDEACADEYDSYLLHVVSLICRGALRGDWSIKVKRQSPPIGCIGPWVILMNLGPIWISS